MGYIQQVGHYCPRLQHCPTEIFVSCCPTQNLSRCNSFLPYFTTNNLHSNLSSSLYVLFDFSFKFIFYWTKQVPLLRTSLHPHTDCPEDVLFTFQRTNSSKFVLTLTTDKKKILERVKGSSRDKEQKNNCRKVFLCYQQKNGEFLSLSHLV